MTEHLLRPVELPADLINPEFRTLVHGAKLIGTIRWVSPQAPVGGDVLVVASEVNDRGDPTNVVAQGVFGDIRDGLSLEYSLDVAVPLSHAPKGFRVTAFYDGGTTPPSASVASLSAGSSVAMASSDGVTRSDLVLWAFAAR